MNHIILAIGAILLFLLGIFAAIIGNNDIAASALCEGFVLFSLFAAVFVDKLKGGKQ